MNNYKAVIFDLDGTLLDTLDDLADAVNYTMREFGFPERSLDEVREFVGNGAKKLIELSMPDASDEVIAAQCLKVFKEYYLPNSKVKTKPYDGIISLLEALRANGYKTAVVTNKPDDAAKETVKHFFGELIDFTVGQVDGVPQKPEPDCVYTALEKLGVSKGEAVFAGDSEVDCITALNAGLDCIGVTWGFRSREVLEEHGARYITDKVDDVYGIV